MTHKNVDAEHLTITGAHKRIETSHLKIQDDVIIIVTQAYGPGGETLIGASEQTFSGYPAVSLWVRAGDQEGMVHLSPVHGDHRKTTDLNIPEGTRCELMCPISKTPLDRLGKVLPNSDAEFFAIYLSPRLTQGAMVAVSDIWGDFHSRIVDNYELISVWADASDASEDEADASS